MFALELFPCSGGMAEGFRRAGIVFDFAFDHDPNACDSYEANHGHRPVQMDVRDLVRMARGGWRPAAVVDLLVADPPCTPWSRAGKREGLADERDMLRETAELIALLRPRAYLVGNLPGLNDSTSWHVVQEILGGLGRYGYCVRDYVALDAADYGVPQRRIRPFWFGHLDGPCIRWPEPTHRDPRLPRLPPPLPGVPGVVERKAWVTCREALGHLPVEDLGRPVRMQRRPQDHAFSNADAPARTVVRNTHGDGTVLNLKHQPSQPSQPSQTIGAKSRGNGACAMEWPWDRPATTVQAQIDKITPANEHAGQFGPNAIILSERPATILQGFAEDWVFAGKTKKARWSQIGQAMPPPLAHAVAERVVAQMEAAREGSCRSSR